jgi:hypothetical protein
MQSLCTCSECGTSVRRDDGPLAPAPEKPKRIIFQAAVGPVLTLDFCDPCFALALEGAQRRAARKPLEPA